jgi:hypothetical protein
MRVLNRETEERNRLLQEEKHSIQRHYQQLKHRIKLYRYVLYSMYCAQFAFFFFEELPLQRFPGGICRAHEIGRCLEMHCSHPLEQHAA